MPPALLAVLSEPGDLVTLSEFHDWYDNEHIPLRLDLSIFLTAARFSAIDGQSPSWLALYDITDPSALQHEDYTQLRTNHSEREADLVKRLEVLDRRICELVWDSGESSKTTSLRAENPTTFIVTHSLEQENAVMWAEKVKEELRGKEEWVRTRVFKCVEALKTGVGVSSGTEAHTAHPFFVLHEFLAQAPTLERSEMLEVRKWALHRTYRCLSQKE